MKGTILSFEKDNHSGLISGHDGKRYKFNTVDIKSDIKKFKESAEVDFEAKEDVATEIFLIKKASSDKERTKTAAMLFTFFLGGFGAQRFYLGQTLGGILSLLFFWTFIPALIACIEFFVLAFMGEEKFDLKYNS